MTDANSLIDTGITTSSILGVILLVLIAICKFVNKNNLKVKSKFCGVELSLGDNDDSAKTVVNNYQGSKHTSNDSNDDIRIEIVKLQRQLRAVSMIYGNDTANDSFKATNVRHLHHQSDSDDDVPQSNLTVVAPNDTNIKKHQNDAVMMRRTDIDIRPVRANSDAIPVSIPDKTAASVSPTRVVNDNKTSLKVLHTDDIEERPRTPYKVRKHGKSPQTINKIV